MKDNYGDKITVTPDFEDVEITVAEGDVEVVHTYTPAKARKLAKLLKAAAHEIDPRPVAEIGTGVHAAVIAATETSSVTADATETSSVTADATETSSATADAPGYTLTLTQEQAETLAVILGKIGGPSSIDHKGRTSARIYAEQVADMLSAAGLDAYELSATPAYAVDPSFGGWGTELNAIYFAPHAK